jgi:hypothetical protein
MPISEQFVTTADMPVPFSEEVAFAGNTYF